MFKPVPMSRLRLVILERDERAVLRELGRVGVVQLTRTAAGPDTAPLPARDRGADLARLEHASARLEKLRRALDLPPSETCSTPGELSPAQADQEISLLEAQTGELLQQRQHLQERLAKLTSVSDQISDYRALELPLDPPDASAFLHFVTGSLPANNLGRLALGPDVALVPLAAREGRQVVIAITTRPGRPGLDRALQAAGFKPETLPVVSGTNTAALSAQNQEEQAQILAEMAALKANLQTLGSKLAPALSRLENLATTERRLLEAGQHFARTENSLLITGWIPDAEVATLSDQIQRTANGCCVNEITPAESLPAEEIPVLLRHPRWLRPFAMLVTAYGLPQYRELEPTLFVALSYLLMFGMMFGDAGHGLVLAAGGLILMLTGRAAGLRDIGLLLLFGGGSSMFFGTLYGSWFGLPLLKKYALWHDPLAGDPMGLMLAAVEIGIVMISLGLVLNILNRFRQGDLAGGLLDKFGVAGAVFYWGALLLLTRAAAIRAAGFWTPSVLLLAGLVLLWLMKAPVQLWRDRRSHPASPVEGGVSTLILESFVGAFEGLLSYFANTISFVRLAAYAMSHAALLLAAFMIAADLRHLSFCGNFLSVLAIILGNLVAIVLEGIVASVQALRLEYYEFFGKFFAGGGQPFQPFRLQSTPVADLPP